MKKSVAFKGDESLKAMLVEEIKKHRAADEIAQGSYGNGQGPWCAVGCSIHSLNVSLGKEFKTNDHSVYETELGIPRIIARLEDRIFENLKPEVAKDFPLRFIEAINTSADLTLAWPKLAVWILVDEKDGVLQYAKNDKTKKAISDVADLYKRVIDGEAIDTDTWIKARRSAADAADAAAYAAADAADAAAYAADAAAYAAYAAYAADAADAAYAADAAAYAADAADAAAYARPLFFAKCADKLIEILSSIHA